MTRLLSGLEPQINFPHEDISDHNAAMLELMLANPTLTMNTHQTSEIMVPGFRIMHPAIIEGSKRAIDNQPVDAIDYGVACFESISCWVQAFPDVETGLLRVQTTKFAFISPETSVQRYAMDAFETFRNELPKTTEVITEGSSRFFPRFMKYVVIGAAVARRLELEAELVR